ncbi:hypothetical protein [Lactobacillus taiwanensis]|uniref:hypothetical protein n=1 Tax=Lactobacillus taiwanensis TaxID=508451 RepID=UPI002729ED4F|nr:hypothetical protein [Lactobacillus taiwanensis]
MIVLNKSSIHSVTSSKVDDFWKHYKKVEFFIWERISKDGFNENLRTVLAANYMQLSIVLTEKDFLVIYLTFKNDILIPLKIQKSDSASHEYMKNGNIVPLAIKVFGFPKPFL